MLSRFIIARFYSSIPECRRVRVRSKMDLNLKCRENPVVTKLDSEEFKNLFTPEVQRLKDIFDKYNYEIRIAGGAVRDLLMGHQPKDLDFATVATPTQMKEMFTVEEIRMINESGEKHGTITPRINDKENFEVTTLRIDMVTDGRHAEVEYTTDWKLDANRRDLTINSMFLGFDGSVYDYFYGYDDLQIRRVAFVGDADKRIKEDYLRILRYFRFYGRIADKPNNHEESTLKTIGNNVEGLQRVSGERIWMELKKILEGKFAGDLLKVMLDVGIAKHIGLPEHPRLDELEKVLRKSAHLTLHPMIYIAALLNDIDEVTLLHCRLKFSAYERDLAYFIVENREIMDTTTRPLLPYQKLVLNSKIKQKDAIEYVREILKYRGDEVLLKSFNEWEVPRFPISGKTLKESGMAPGVLFGRIISQLKEVWIEKDFKISADELTQMIPDIVTKLKIEKPMKNK